MIKSCIECPCCMQEYKNLSLCCYRNKWMSNVYAKYCDYALDYNIECEVVLND